MGWGVFRRASAGVLSDAFWRGEAETKNGSWPKVGEEPFLWKSKSREQDVV
jgi:hypothetical protein